MLRNRDGISVRRPRIPTKEVDHRMTADVVGRRWYTVAEVAQQLGFGLTKTKMLVLTGEIRSIKHGRHRRIPPAAVDEFVERIVAEALS